MLNEYDEWNKVKKEFAVMLGQLTHVNTLLMGVGVPNRLPSYIFGRPLESSNII